jgi:predicted metal-binding protein
MAAECLYVCETCIRDAPVAVGAPTFGRRLADAIEALLADGRDDTRDLQLRRVLCLNGCLSPSNIALRTRGKYTLRFGRLEPADAPAVLDFAARYLASTDGNVPERDWPEALRGKNTVRTPPPRRSSEKE